MRLARAAGERQQSVKLDSLARAADREPSVRPGSLARAAGRELAFGLRTTSREVARWRSLAGSIPDGALRADALAALEGKRGNIHGAALFWTVPARRSRPLLRALVAWEVLADFLDCVSERHADLGIDYGRRLHLALVDALRPGTPTGGGRLAEETHEGRGYGGAPAGACRAFDAYPTGSAAGGYVRALLGACREGCGTLPGYATVRPLALRAARLTEVLAINHEPDTARRDAALRRWAQQKMPESELSWFERTAAASSWLTVLAVVAHAAEPQRHRPTSTSQAEAVYDAYLEAIAPVGAMLDSYGDIGEDSINGHHSYIAHYPSREVAVERIGEMIADARLRALGLPRGERHAVILACMVAFYLSKDSVRTAEMRESTAQLLRAGGPLAIALAPVLRAWRIGFRQRAA